jgi:RNA polymerase sigma-70 factor (ECF subfamily)
MLTEGTHTIVSANEKLEKIVELFGAGVLKYCHSILLDYHEAQDVAQTIFASAFTALGKGKEISSAWLYRSGYNMCIDILRRKKFQRFFSLRQVEPVYNDEYFMSDEVSEILKILPPKDRALVFSRAVEGKSYEQLEAIYGIKAATLRQRYTRAKKKLSEVLKDES